MLRSKGSHHGGRPVHHNDEKREHYICWQLEGQSEVELVGTSLVAQWLKIHLPKQGTRVRALVWEDPTCHGATKPMSHNY
ncbi:hypothetical protein J1605_006666 [Eschrichtius robustus]|uniref:Uncharacterized protein n=1 Tax=Eschrichtius robustus TaxID=9764 RepID=A0AB34GZY6_ESCRO|nr:hypothetical protein J1605_006666 [Eschrichtius robustus]